MRLRLAAPAAVVDIQDVGDLRFVACDGELVRMAR
jgi:hypothetical protein